MPRDIEERLHVAALLFAANADVRASKGSKDELNKGIAKSCWRAARLFVDVAHAEIQAEIDAEPPPLDLIIEEPEPPHLPPPLPQVLSADTADLPLA